MRNHKWWKFDVSLAAVVLAFALTLGCQQTPPTENAEDAAETSEGAQGESSAAVQGDRQSGSSAKPKPAVRSATLESGAQLRVRTMNALSTKSAKSGEAFTASLEEPITDGQWVIAPKGATVHGVVVESDPGGKVKGVAKLAVRLTKLETADGQMIDVTTNSYATQAKPTKKDDAKKIGIGSGVGAAIGAITGGGKGAAIGAGAGAGAGTGVVLATRGDPAVIPSESVLTFTLREPVTITRKE